jgi:hypothetical protein
MLFLYSKHLKSIKNLESKIDLVVMGIHIG